MQNRDLTNKPELTNKLNDLIRTCRDGEEGFRACAEQASAPRLRAVFEERAQQCAKSAEELKGLLVAMGAEPSDRSSVPGVVHRGWVTLKGKVTGHDDKAALEECERGEDVAVAAYREAVALPMPEHIRQVIMRQYAGAQRNHDQIRALRDEFRNEARAV
jgi:uncharacterized protein (TIGR02284 family)